MSQEEQRKYHIRREILSNNPELPPKRIEAVVDGVYKYRFK